MARYKPGWHVYTCGPDRYMDAVIVAAEQAGFTEDERHLEYFSVPEQPDYVNHNFTLKLARSGREFLIPADKTATDVLAENGIHVDVKCSDGICGVCKCGLLDGEVEHRDFVLSKKQREGAIILCQSRAADDGVVTVDMGDGSQDVPADTGPDREARLIARADGQACGIWLVTEG